MKMASGIGAAAGTRRAVVLCMVLAGAWGLHAGWVGALLTGGDPTLWVARPVALWIVLVTWLWPTAPTRADWVCMCCCLLVISAMACLALYEIIRVVTDGIALQAAA